MPTPKKAKKLVRVYLDAEEAGMLADAKQSFEGWTESDVMSLVMGAGLRALRAENYRFPWPLAFGVVSKGHGPPPPRLALNEPKSSRGKQ